MSPVSTLSPSTIIAVICLSALWVSGAPPRELKFRAQEIDSKLGIGYGVAVADVDGDKRPDIVLVDKDVVAWYRNPTWEKFVIAEKLTPKDHVCVAAADIDGDGKAEIAVGAEWNPSDTENSGAVFYLVAPADRTQRWKPLRWAHEPTVHRMRWATNWDGKAELVVAPLHGRGNNPSTGEGVPVRVLAYVRPTDPAGVWTTRLLNEALHKTHNFEPIQWDTDVASEFLLCGKEGVFVLNWSRESTALVLTAIGTNNVGGAGEVRSGRLAGGNRFIATVEPMHGNTLAVYHGPKAGAEAGLWRRQVIDESLLDGHALACGDLAGTGSDQIVVGWRAMGRPNAKVGIKIFTPKDGAGTVWSQTLVDDNGMACEDLCLADLDGNGRLDIVASGRGTKNLKIYFSE